MSSGPIPLGAFELLRPHARGAMSELWAGRHRDLDRPVAIKVLSAEAADQPGAQQAFRSEVRAAASLEHPFIVQLLDYGVLPAGTSTQDRRLRDGSPYLVIEWLPMSLAAHGALHSWDELRSVLDHLLQALAHSHSRGVTHRDLKPSNILLPNSKARSSRLDRLKLADFGIAQSIGRTHGQLAGYGSPGYMAPEQIEGRWRDQGPWTDLYALGCLIHKLCSGSTPFGGGSASEVRRRQLHEIPAPLRAPFALPAGLQPFLDGLLQKDPWRRTRRAADALRALRALDDDRTERSAAPRIAKELSGAGLGLWGLRPIPLVGREVERELVQRELETVAREGGVRVLLIHGAIGVGKTRLARWLLERTRENGSAEVWRAFHGPTQGAESGLGPMLRRRLRCGRLDREATITRIRALLQAQGCEDLLDADGLADCMAPGATSPGRAMPRAERYERLRDQLRREAAGLPTLLILEDVPYALDALGFVQHLLQVETSPTLILLTAREEARPDRPTEEALLSELLEDDRVRDLALAPLQPAQHEILVRQLLLAPGEQVQRVAQRTAGNPLFAILLVDDWVQRGLFKLGPRGFHLPDGIPKNLPAGLQGVWRRRVDGLLAGWDDASAHGLELAAALGMDIDEDELLATCAAANLSPPLRLIDVMLERRLAIDAGESRRGWSFANGMFREAVELRAREAGRLEDAHRAVARMLENREAHDRTERLGRHLLAAGEHEAALDPLLRSAQARTRLRDPLAARTLLEDWSRAADGVGLAPEHLRRDEARIVLARSYRLEERCIEARAELEPVLDRRRRQGDERVLAGAGAELAQIARMLGDGALAWAIIEEAMEVGGAVEDESLRVELLARQATLLMDRGDLKAAEQTLSEAIAASQRLELHGRTGYLLMWLSGLHIWAGRLDEAEHYIKAAIGATMAAGLRSGMGDCLVQYGELARAHGRLDEAEEHYRDALERYAEAGTGDELVPWVNIGLLMLSRARYEEADELLAQSAKTAKRQGRRNLEMIVRTCRLAPLAAAGCWEDLDERLSEIELFFASSTLIDADVALVCDTTARLAADAGRPKLARRVEAIAQRQRAALERS